MKYLVSLTNYVAFASDSIWGMSALIIEVRSFPVEIMFTTKSANDMLFITIESNTFTIQAAKS